MENVPHCMKEIEGGDGQCRIEGWMCRASTGCSIISVAKNQKKSPSDQKRDGHENILAILRKNWSIHTLTPDNTHQCTFPEQHQKQIGGDMYCSLGREAAP